MATDENVVRIDRRRLGIGAGRLVLGGLAAGVLGGAAGAGRGAAAQDDLATPAAVSGDLLALVPETPPLVALADPSPLAVFADIAAQLDAVGVTPPATLSTGTMKTWFPALSGLHLGAVLDASTYAAEDWRRVHGWDAAQVDGVAGFGLQEDRAVMVRGRFDHTAIRAAWDAVGYVPDSDQPSGEDAPEILSSADADLDVTDMLLVWSAFTYATILPGGEVAYAASRAGIDRAIARARGETAPVTEQTGVPAMLAAGGALVSGAIVPGVALRGSPVDDMLGAVLTEDGPADPDAVMATVEAAEAARAAMPPIELALLGISAGGPVPLDGAAAGGPGAAIQIVLRYADDVAAGVARTVLEDRLATGTSAFDNRPWTEIFAGWTVESVPDDAALVLVRLDPLPDGRGAWIPLWFGGSPGFLAWA